MPKVLKAVIRYRDNEYGAFEVMTVLGHVRRTLPGVMICLDDRAWRDYNWFQECFRPGEGGGALGVALRDGIRRGPRYHFRFVTKSGEVIRGWAARDTVGFQSEQDFPPELEHKIRAFLESLQLGQPKIEAY